MATMNTVANVTVSVNFFQGNLHSLGAGTLMGMIHAVTGPDHMSALVTLSVNQRCAAAWLGIRWGIGHSTGLLIVTGIVLILRDSYGLNQGEMLELFSGGMNWVVGIIMLMLGLRGYQTAWRLRRELLHPTLLGPTSSSRVHPSRDSTMSNSSGHTPQTERPCESKPGSVACTRGIELHGKDGWIEEAVRQDQTVVRPQAHRVPHYLIRCVTCKRCHNMSARATTQLIALGVGILHGIGGPGGVLAVLPTLLIPGIIGSCLYLGGFCVSATLTMGIIAGVYGACTYRSRAVSPHLPWMLSVVSASTSMCIGVLWLVCSATGTLEDVLVAFGIE